MKVYIITSYFGEYEDRSQYVEGVFENAIDAEDTKTAIEAEYAEYSKEVLDDIDFYTSSEAEIDAWFEKQQVISNAKDFVFCKISEHELIESKQK